MNIQVEFVARHLLALLLVGTITACSGTQAPAVLDKWSWLPVTHTHDAEAARIPRDAALSLFIPKDDPLEAGSDGGWGGIDTFGNFTPTDRKSYVVKGGSLVSKIGPIERRAKFGDWDVLYSDAARTQRAGWGNCLTSGEILVPRETFADPSADLYAQNSFAIETFGPTYLLVRLDPARKHKLCFLEQGGGQMLTAGVLGSKAEVGTRVLERRADGWYAGDVRFSN